MSGKDAASVGLSLAFAQTSAHEAIKGNNPLDLAANPIIDVQATSPGADSASNWLPAPTGAYDLVMRIAGPDQRVLDGDWKSPERQQR